MLYPFLLFSVIVKYKSVDKDAIVAVNQPRIVNKSSPKITDDNSEVRDNTIVNTWMCFVIIFYLYFFCEFYFYNRRFQ